MPAEACASQYEHHRVGYVRSDIRQGQPMIELIPRDRRTLAAGAVHLPDWLDLRQQRELVAACREWAREGPGIRAASLPNGARMSVQTVCLGWHWYPYRYSRAAPRQ
jgi:alkylated DNA repair protein (DNA oxidative demethylase)